MLEPFFGSIFALCPPEIRIKQKRIKNWQTNKDLSLIYSQLIVSQARKDRGKTRPRWFTLVGHGRPTWLLMSAQLGLASLRSTTLGRI